MVINQPLISCCWNDHGDDHLHGDHISAASISRGLLTSFWSLWVIIITITTETISYLLHTMMITLIVMIIIISAHPRAADVILAFMGAPGLHKHCSPRIISIVTINIKLIIIIAVISTSETCFIGEKKENIWKLCWWTTLLDYRLPPNFSITFTFNLQIKQFVIFSFLSVGICLKVIPQTRASSNRPIFPFPRTHPRNKCSFLLLCLFVILSIWSFCQHCYSYIYAHTTNATSVMRSSLIRATWGATRI